MGSRGLNKVLWNTEAKVNSLVWGPSQGKLKFLFLDSLFLGPCLESRGERRGARTPWLWPGEQCSRCHSAPS